MRPGRIDRKIEYQLASQQQAQRLFLRFFPESKYSTATSKTVDESADTNEKQSGMARLAGEFASVIPPNEFSMAELQGYLLGCRTAPTEAVRGIEAWVERERQARRDKDVREQLRKERIWAAKARQRRSAYDPVFAGVPKVLAPLPARILYNSGYSEHQPSGELPRDSDTEPGLNTADLTVVDRVLHESSDNTGNLNGTCDTSLTSLPSAEDPA